VIPRQDPRAQIIARIPFALLTLGIGIFAIVRLSLVADDFDNPDIAGIAYNADIILRGGLPYRETVDLKPPGTFFVFAGTFALLGRSLGAVQLVYAGWLLLGAPAVWLAAKSLYGDDPRGGRHAPAVATFVYLLSAGQFDYNYSSWMMPPFAWAFALALLGFQRSSFRWHVAAGAAAMVALAMKGQGIVIALALGVLWIRARRFSPLRRAVLPWIAWSLGALAAFAPLLVLYAAEGALTGLLHGVFPIARGATYAASMQSPVPWYTLGAWAGLQLANVFPLASAAAIATVVGWGLDRRDGTSSCSLVPALALFMASIVGVVLGGPRFYTHHLVQYLPALSLMAAHPSGWGRLGSGARASSLGRTIRAGAGAALVLLLVLQILEVARGDAHRYDARLRRLEGGSTPAQVVGRHIQAGTRTEDTIMVWGWSAWPVYFWAERSAPTPAFKPLGSITEFNTNSAFFPGRPIAFRPGVHADALMEAFRERAPAYFVYSPSFVTTFGCERDPIVDFTALVQVLEAEYFAEAQVGDLLLLRRKDLSRPRRANDVPSE
jgi:hypothetical protein